MSLQTGSAVPLSVLLEMDGTMELERMYHRLFAKFRLSGEWFAKSPEILAFIDEKLKKAEEAVPPLPDPKVVWG